MPRPLKKIARFGEVPSVRRGSFWCGAYQCKRRLLLTRQLRNAQGYDARAGGGRRPGLQNHSSHCSALSGRLHSYEFLWNDAEQRSVIDWDCVSLLRKAAKFSTGCKSRIRLVGWILFSVATKKYL